MSKRNDVQIGMSKRDDVGIGMSKGGKARIGMPKEMRLGANTEQFWHNINSPHSQR